MRYDITRLLLTRALLAAATMVANPVAAKELVPPVVFWSAEPVLPGETAMLQGWGWGSEPEAIRIELASSGDPDTQWQEVTLLDTTVTSLRFFLPPGARPNIYRCRIVTPGGTIERQLNRPQPWWFQADRGQTGTPGGWLRVFGRCLELIEGKARLELRQDAQMVTAPIDEATMWNLTVRLPDDLAAGDWQVCVHNGSGSPDDWVTAGMLRVSSQRQFWNDRMFEVAAFGAVPNDRLDDSDAFQQALAAVAENGGGIIRFGRGRFHFSRGFQLPPRLLLEGAGPEATHLVWADTENPPAALLSSTTGQLALRDLSLYAHNYLGGLEVGGPTPDERHPEAPRPSDVMVERVTVRFTPLSTRLSPEARAARRGLRTSALLLNADRVTVVDCDVSWYSNIGVGICGNDAVFHGNRCHAQHGGWCFVGSGRRAIVERNRYTGITTGATRTAEVWFAHNRVEHHYVGFREGFTTDGTFGGPGFLDEVELDGRHVRFTPRRPRTDGRTIPAAVRILDGKGAGLVQQIESFDADRKGFMLARPWQVTPDDTSLLWACNEMGRHIYYDNDVSDTGIAIQLYGSAHDCVVAGNRSRRSGGFRVKGNWTCNNVMFLDNEIPEGYGTIGPEQDGGSSSINVEGPYVDGFKGVTARGFVIRRNRLSSEAKIFIRGSVYDVLIEANDIANSSRGIFADMPGRQHGVLVYDNHFENVAAPIDPPEPVNWRLLNH